MKNYLRKFFRIIIVIFIFSDKSYGYNSERCYAFMERLRYGIGTGELISSTQFTSSFGECSLMGDREKEIERYFYINYNSIKTDASRGRGEFLDGLASLLSCNEEAGKRLSKYMQGDFEKIFNAEDEKIKDAKELYSNFRKKMLVDRREYMSCIF